MTNKGQAISGFVIDPFAESVTWVRAASLSEIRELVEVELLERAVLGDGSNVWVDEEGLLKDVHPKLGGQRYFVIEWAEEFRLFAGKAFMEVNDEREVTESRVRKAIGWPIDQAEACRAARGVSEVGGLISDDECMRRLMNKADLAETRVRALTTRRASEQR